MNVRLKDEGLELGVRRGHKALLRKDKLLPQSTTLSDLKHIEIHIKEPNKPKSISDYSKKQCSPGDLLVASPWRTY